MCYLVSHDKLQLDYEDNKNSIGDRSIPDNAKTKALKLLGATIDFIYIWLNFFLKTFNARCDAYINSMTEMFKQIPLTIKNALTPQQRV